MLPWTQHHLIHHICLDGPDTTQLPYFWRAITAPDGSVFLRFPSRSTRRAGSTRTTWCATVSLLPAVTRKPVKRLLAFHLCASLGMLHFLPSLPFRSRPSTCGGSNPCLHTQSDRECCVMTLQELICKITTQCAADPDFVLPCLPEG
jgi:hypothetical protein